MATTKNTRTILAVLATTLVASTLSTSVSAHHGTGVSYDMTHPMTLKAVVTEFNYVNPHPTLFFDVTDEKGNKTHWVSEMITNVSFLLRAGWTKSRSQAALKPGTSVTLTLAQSLAGTKSAVIMKILNEQGEEVVQGRPGDRNALVDK